MDDKQLWEDFQICFNCESSRIPDNKLYAEIDLKPKSARRLIKAFHLIVNGCHRAEFDSSYEHILASGFDIEQEREITVKIKAIPMNQAWSRIKESNEYKRSLAHTITTLSPTINIEYGTEINANGYNLVIQWYHIGDQNVRKYIVVLDDKEIHFVNQNAIQPRMKVCIKFSEWKQKPITHTVQILAQLKRRKIKYCSDPITFEVSNSTDRTKHSPTVIYVLKQPTPPNSPGEDQIQKPNNMDKTGTSSENFRRRAEELYQQLLDIMQKKAEKNHGLKNDRIPCRPVSGLTGQTLYEPI